MCVVLESPVSTIPPAPSRNIASRHHPPRHHLHRRRPRRRRAAYAKASAPPSSSVRADDRPRLPQHHQPAAGCLVERLAGRLDAGPAALHRLPEPVLHAAEGLWLQTLSEARKRAATEQGSSRSALAKDRQETGSAQPRARRSARANSRPASNRPSAAPISCSSRSRPSPRCCARNRPRASPLSNGSRRTTAPRADDAMRGRAPQPTAARSRAKVRAATKVRATVRSPAKSRKPLTKSARTKTARSPTPKVRRR